MYQYTYATNEKELSEILALQVANLPNKLTLEERKAQGFVTVVHDLNLLEEMNRPYQHAIVKCADELAGYALVMLADMREKIPVLVPLFDKVDSLSYRGELLKDANYFVMGQICIDKPHRGKGLFQGLYEQLNQQMAADFDFMITEVSKRNTRSLRAHEKVGFQVIHDYATETEEWVVLLMDYKTRANE